MDKKKFVTQMVGVFVGNFVNMLGLLTPLPTILFSGLGVGIICFNILLSAFVNLDYNNGLVFLPLILTSFGLASIFTGLLTPLSMLFYCILGSVLIIGGIIFMMKMNKTCATITKCSTL